ncbi:MAG TPA: hypothetical protein VLK78_07525 [Candidatus Angelobacter sp.]|nr:hypothetical protein [Candidatus Angelobacter sp.]
MFILMIFFLLIGLGLIGHVFFQWVNLSRLLFRDLIILKQLMLLGCIGLVLLLISLFTLF